MIHGDFPPVDGFAGSQPFVRIQTSHCSRINLSPFAVSSAASVNM
jgi:hypothetical protein